MIPSFSLLFPLLFLFLFPSPTIPSLTELPTLMAIKASLDPQNELLTSWIPNTDPCSGSFDGVACDKQGRVANISLQGKALSGTVPAALAELKSLTGLYLHFNALTGKIPKDIARLTQLSDLYLNVNNLSGEIPAEIGKMYNLQVLQLCCNRLTGGIPTQVGNMWRLSVLALQYNHLTGAIPASLGNLPMLTRLDLSFNRFFGPIPVTLVNAPILEVLDIRNNSLLGIVPSALKRLHGGFQYKNNPGLCGIGFSNLSICKATDGLNPNRPEPIEPGNPSTKTVPESVPLKSECSKNQCPQPSKPHQVGVVLGVIGVIIIALAVSGIFTFSWYRQQKQEIGSAIDTSDSRLRTDQVEEIYRKSTSPLISLEYSNGWDPMDKGRSGFSKEVLESFMFNLEDVERATQCFSKVNLLGKSNFSAMYKGILGDGSVIAIKCISKTSCKSDEAEFLKGLKILTSLKHENLVGLRGFCCSKGRGKCFLIYDFVPNGCLSEYLDVKGGSGKVLEWTARVSIINGIAKGIRYLHGNKPAIVHQNISAEKVLIDGWYNPLLSDSGLHKLLADDIVFSTLKASAAMGYLAPEYITTGHFTEKSNVFAFGMIIFQIIAGKRIITQLNRQGVESCRFDDFVDINLEGKFLESEAAKLGRIALLCTHENANQRPSMESVMQELNGPIGS
ncbi:LRR receptor-like serine/threonine-protein kinase RGI5 [Carya illinoinensis]|uniref:LRR receptor-like serine/threonine-protein kinase RGI5 n=1 Tax=Carya illinoinensis TaxID=32201 RepID=UPI001C72440D|nr:LRR receptor-like serine/threonine-protein kinase RGI5 [Carya illinoinensis]